ncbi:MAG: FAD-dependent oxidoreductase, partial [Synechococcus sp. BS307-5m-G39]|nr:FAD-dependent oxidoreductase [Synechococcus sp. BS307-5m-G39]
MLRLSELRLELDHTEEDLERAVLRCLKIPRDRLLERHLVKRSIDARRRDRIRLIYSVDVQVRGEDALLRRFAQDRRVRRSPDERYHYVT